MVHLIALSPTYFLYTELEFFVYLELTILNYCYFTEIKRLKEESRNQARRYVESLKRANSIQTDLIGKKNVVFPFYEINGIQLCNYENLSP